MSSPREAPHVALIIETSKIYGREILRGVASFIQVNPGWSVFATERGHDDPDPRWLESWNGAGIITRSMDLEQCRLAKERGIAVVSLRHLVDQPEFPTLLPDQEIIARRVVDHFLERGVSNFGYVGVSGRKGWERMRRKAFLNTLNEKGDYHIALRPELADLELSWEEEQEQIVSWVKGLPKPIGVMVAHDTQGIQIIDACRRAGIQVPDEVAIVSVDNDPALCELSSPPLSSLDQHVHRLGFEAAKTLDRMMKGEEVAANNYFVEPGHVVVRRSSDVLAIEDERISKAIRFIRDHACENIDVESVAQTAGLSRRSLETKFRQMIKRSPLEEIQEGRYRRVRQLLLETDFVLADVAEMSGFQYQEYLVRFFKKRTGMTPGQFRRKMRFDT